MLAFWSERENRRQRCPAVGGGWTELPAVGLDEYPSLRLPQTLFLEPGAAFCFLQPHVP